MNFDENELKTSNNTDSHETNFEYLFKLYDPNGTGTIKTEDFISKTQDFIRDLNFEQVVNINIFFYLKKITFLSYLLKIKLKNKITFDSA